MRPPLTFLQTERSGGSRLSSPARPATTERGSVLVIVIWICLGLVALTLYFADSMTSELRAADNRAAEIAARQAVAGGTRYAAYVLSQYATDGTVPDFNDYESEELPIGEASVWFIGRDPSQVAGSDPVFGLVDEASKLNLNTASRTMLEALPNITPELVEAIISWRSRKAAGAGDSTYGRLDPPRVNKGAPFESIDELRLVYGATLDLLFGEDTNRNGVLDDNENDSERSAPRDNGDGLLQAGILEYVTVYSREPNTRANGGRRVNVSTAANREQVRPALRQRFGQARGDQILLAIGTQQINSIAEFMVRGRLTADEWAQVRGEITTSNGATIQGLINVNTASETVLACIPGIGAENAAAIVAYRLANPDLQGSFFWLTEVLPPASLIRAGQYLTDRSYQFSADVAAVGLSGRGYCREKTIFDLTQGTPRMVYHQDLTAYGWALGYQVRQIVREARERRS